MNEFEKQIYNTYLIVSRSINDKPFRLREDFTNFESSSDYLPIKKLSAFFKKHKHLNIKSFFEAPYFIYNEKYFPLDFFCSFKAVSTYTKYNDSFLVENLDSKVVSEKIKESISFIASFCSENKIKIKDYIRHKDGIYYSFLNHLKERKINVYILFAFDSFEPTIKDIDYNTKLMLAPSLTKVNYLRTKLYSSTEMKKKVNFIKNFLDNQK